MHSTHAFDAELGSLRRTIARLRLGLSACGAAVVSLIALGMAPQERPDEVLRVKGLIVEDSAGRARVLIGAPVPAVPERVRTDREKVVAAWGERYGGVMDWYFEGVSNDAFGMLLLDENGHDRIAIGAPTPDPCTGKRIEPSHGIQISDEEGFEVGGFGYFAERRMTGLGLDNASGEGLYLLAAENGTSGMIVNDHEDGARLFVGLSRGDSGLAPSAKHLGATLLEADGEWWTLGKKAGFEKVDDGD